jgi:predicted restriction endonuclease
VAFALYCRIPHKEIKLTNKLIIRAAETLDACTPEQLKPRIQKYEYLDTENTPRPLGFANVANQSREVFNDYKNDWYELRFQAEKILGIGLFDRLPDKGSRPISDTKDHPIVRRERASFREAVYETYKNRCCISGSALSLRASHIKPYSISDRTARLSPQNGLCLSAQFDDAFDKGLITIDKNLTIHVAINHLRRKNIDTSERWLIELRGRNIAVPERNSPSVEYIDYHNKFIFKDAI